MTSRSLSPQQKMLAILLCLGFLMITGTYAVLKTLIYPAFAGYENDLAATRVARLEQAIDGQLDVLAMLNREYSEWDDSYQYMVAPESIPDFIEENMDEVYWSQMGVELLMILDRDGRLRWGMLSEAGDNNAVALNAVAEALLRRHPLLRSQASVNSYTRGLIDSPLGLMMIVSAPITRTDGSGPAVGSLLVGRIMNVAKITRIAEAVNAGVAMYFLAEPALPARISGVPAQLEGSGKHFLVGTEEERGYTLSLLRDVYGDPAAVVEITAELREGATAAGTVTTALILLILGTLAFVLVAWLLLRAYVTDATLP